MDEGSWKYLIGDRPDYSALKVSMAQSPVLEAPVRLTVPYLNSSAEFVSVELNAEAPAYPFPDQVERIRNDNAREFSDIVLLRKAIIEAEVARPEPDRAKLMRALHWNIRQRDRGTLNLAYGWLLAADPKVSYLNDADQLFVLERMIDFFTFQQDFEAIGHAITKLPHLFRQDPRLTVRVAEHYFRHHKRFHALYYFARAYQRMPNNLGVTHGLGCTLLDLRFPRVAVYFLEKSHRLSPGDQTACFTLLRACHACGKKARALHLLSRISNHLRPEAERILGVAA